MNFRSGAFTPIFSTSFSNFNCLYKFFLSSSYASILVFRIVYKDGDSLQELATALFSQMLAADLLDGKLQMISMCGSIPANNSQSLFRRLTTLKT